ncbi:hypothetical protein Q0Z83_024800 [Actinoplanes sichuanensis]|uniref:Uncharacterized protein n=1 Tax=Actinoplanes sichuanensis TaxID=512349 RepID=A0ABW4A059_9ACTN|nr:hypothetical protein [Actinoplanes sichuanensis]BEL04289.1 hypothetical protein Q0Z83_024800 [Actinoplanes sichuanensis]
MPRKKMWVTYEDDAELSKSHKRPGSFSPLTREDGTNKLGHVTLDPIDEDEEDDDEPSVSYVFHTHTHTYEHADTQPQQKRAEQDDDTDLVELVALGVAALAVTAAPAVRKTVEWWRKRRQPRAALTPGDMAREVSEALKFFQIGGSRIEARDRIVEALTAQLRDSKPLTQQQLGEGVRLALEASPSLRDEAALTDLRKILEN